MKKCFQKPVLNFRFQRTANYEAKVQKSKESQKARSEEQKEYQAWVKAQAAEKADKTPKEAAPGTSKSTHD